MTETLFLSIAATGFVVAFAHAAIPTHWLPFVLAGRGQRWSKAKTLAVVALCGSGRVLFTTLLGVLVVWLGLETSQWTGSVFPWIAGGALILLGLYYPVRQARGGGHSHEDHAGHDHACETKRIETDHGGHAHQCDVHFEEHQHAAPPVAPPIGQGANPAVKPDRTVIVGHGASSSRVPGALQGPNGTRTTTGSAVGLRHIQPSAFNLADVFVAGSAGLLVLASFTTQSGVGRQRQGAQHVSL
jgi:hypothetical protein